MDFELRIVGDKIAIAFGGNIAFGGKREHVLSISPEQAGRLMVYLENARHFLAQNHQFFPVVIEDDSD